MHITATLYDRPNYSGGPAVNLCRLLPALQDRGHQLSCLVIYQGGDAPNGKLLESKGVHCRYLTMEECLWFSDRIADWILDQLAELHPDAFIANVSAPAGYAGAIARQHGIPSVSTIRGESAFNWSLGETFGQKKGRWHGSGIVCVSDDIRDRFRERWDTVPSCTIPSGVPLPDSVADQSEHRLRMVYAGRMEGELKGVDELCTHLFPWIAGRKDVELTLLGTGGLDDWITAQIALHGIADRVALRDTLRGDRYHEVLREHDALLLYSYSEGTPGSVMDGMACGLVPVVRDIPGTRQLVPDSQTGIRFSEADDALLQTLSELVHDRASRLRMAECSRKHIEAQFSLPCAARAWEAFLQQLCGDAGQKRKLPPSPIRRLPPPHPDFGTEDLRDPNRKTPGMFSFLQRLMAQR